MAAEEDQRSTTKMQKSLGKLLMTSCFSIRHRLVISAEEPASATALCHSATVSQCHRQNHLIGFLCSSLMFDGQEKGNGLSLPLLDFEACDFPLKKSKCFPSSPAPCNEWSYQRAWEISPLNARARLPLTLMRVVSTKKRGSLFVCKVLAFIPSSLAQT